MGSPLELISLDDRTHKFVVGRQALEALRAVRGPIGVVAVCGRARQGKSYILNQLLGRSSGFKVSSTQKPCTKGLWLWSKPIKQRAPDGREYHLVLIDSEGIDAYDQTAHYSTQIFALAILLSSLFVYNQMGGIDEAALDRLALVTEMTNVIRVRSQGSGDSDLGGFTPEFLWLLRDFYLELEEDGRKITPRDYLEQALMSATGTGAAVEMKNKIRRSIKNLFPHRDCFALVRPVSDEQQLKNLENVPMGRLRPEFTQELRRLMEVIFSRAVPKSFGHQVITGPALAGLTEAYVKAINEGAVPTIVTAWQAVSDGECRRARDLAEAHYREAFNEKVSPEDSALIAEHQRALGEARNVYNANAIGDEDTKRIHQARFEEAVNLWFTHFRDRKMAESDGAIDHMLREASGRFQEFMRSGGDATQFQARLKLFMQQYDCGTCGPTKWPKLTEFVFNSYSSFAAGQEQRLKGQIEAQRGETEKTRQAAAELESAKREVLVLRREKELTSGRASNLERQLEAFRSAKDLSEHEQRATEEKLSSTSQELQRSKADAERVKREACGLQESLLQEQQARQSAEAELERLRERLGELEIEAQRACAAEPPATPPGQGGNSSDRSPQSMTIKEIKEWLLAKGHGGDIWDMEKTGPKKADWIKLMERVMQES
eukprot:evm.model.scf_1894.2 EVM.evm.TU.scf_1894.2   scf_1894:8241-19466(-)